MILLQPVHAFDLFEEVNHCHGLGTKGHPCEGEQRGPLTYYGYPEHSVKIPAYLKDDVARAARAGILTVHRQSADPVRDVTGVIHDPLATSSAQRGQKTFVDDKTGLQMLAPTGQVSLTTLGGEFDPMEETWGKWGPTGKRKKTVTPDMLKDPATPEDVISTYRHEVGHLMDNSFKGSASLPVEMAREIRAWTYAVEIAPDHRVSEKMLRSGLESHSYFSLRVQDVARSAPSFIPSWDRAEWAERQVRQEITSNTMDAATLSRARTLSERVVKSLTRYGDVLRSRGVVRNPDPYLGKIYRWQTNNIIPGPGRGGLI